MQFQHPVKVTGEIKGGGLGQLLRCLDAAGRKFVAKFPKDFSPQNQAMVTAEERRLRRWQGKNIVRYLGPVHHTDGRAGYAMEEMDASLADIMKHQGALSEVRALEYLQGAAAGLRDVHHSGIAAFHGDVKPANILVRGASTKMADFGLARGGYGQTMIAGPHDGGTPGYFPPEGRSSAAGDVYALGVTLKALLVGVDGAAAVQATPRTTRETAALVSAMLERDPYRRITMGDVVKRLPAALAAARQRRTGAISTVAVGILAVLAFFVVVPAVVAAVSKSR
jgi:serine/threonine protein kinase